MKKIIFSVMLLCSSTIGFAQLLDVTSTEKVNLPEGTVADIVTLSPKGDYMLLSDQKKQGLQKFDFRTGEIKSVTKALGSNYNAKISDDGNTVFFRKNQFGKDRLKKTALKSVNLTTGEVKTLVQPTREMKAVQTGTRPEVSIKYGQLMITRNGKTETLSPNGQSGQSYLWPSVSPDGTKIVYYLATKGAYTCNIDGTDVQFVGNIRAPKWYNNEIVVGMNDKDNGEFVTSSSIVAYAADGSEKQVLTGSDKIAMYPTATKDGGKIAFTTPQGEAYIINVKTK